MCNVSQRFIDYGIEQGIAQGKALGAMQTAVENIRALMESLDLSFEEAVKLLKIPADKIPQYRAYLCP